MRSVFVCVFLVLNGKLTSCQPSAPADQQQQCIATNVPTDPGHMLVGAYSATQKPLLDSFWYVRVFGNGGVWTGIQGNTGDNGVSIFVVTFIVIFLSASGYSGQEDKLHCVGPLC